MTIKIKYRYTLRSKDLYEIDELSSEARKHIIEYLDLIGETLSEATDNTPVNNEYLRKMWTDTTYFPWNLFTYIKKDILKDLKKAGVLQLEYKYKKKDKKKNEMSSV